MINIFYVEVKNEEGEYEPLGVMKLEEALAWCWEHDHCTMRTLFLGRRNHSTVDLFIARGNRMPYLTRTRDRILRRPIAAQNTIPDQDIWYQRMADAEQARYDDEDYNWYLQNRGVMQPDGSYFGEEFKPAPRLDYDPRVRQVGQPMRDYEAYGDYDRRLMENVGDLVLGYDPREGSPDYEYENPSAMDKAMFAGVFAPGAVGRVAGAALGADIAHDIARGRRVPGALDMMWLGGMGARAAKKAAWMYGQDRLTRAIRKRAARQAARRALNAPQGRVMRNAATGRLETVSPYIEEVPYEEVRF